jgi:hypothetical protein
MFIEILHFLVAKERISMKHETLAKIDVMHCFQRVLPSQ